MNYPKLINLALILFATIVYGCGNTNNSKRNSAATVEKQMAIEEGTITFIPDEYGDEEIIFYNLFSPVDLTYLVSKKEAFYNSSLINPLNNITKYSASSKVAINLGVYGADISYLWMFEQQQQALSYRAAIQRLTDQLEIPRDFVSFSYTSAESNSQNFDSLVHIAKVTYWKTDEYLKKTNRKHSASLVLLGGWIETLYIATHMYDEPNSNLLGKIAIQKFSLNSLISLLQLSQQNINISEYLLLLRKLKKAFDKLEVQFPPESLVIDTSMKHIRLNNHEELNLNVDDFSEIKRVTRQIRYHMIR
ncbi:MAG: hypothetical protein PF517_13230 [Salinivirgaceae bacterium]|jgi:hypothetical protein|nr:hypothetical protein [Salinivirgaceae bacterium]